MQQRSPLLCSSGTFSRYPDYTDYRAILRYAPQLPVDGIEVMLYPQWYDYIDSVIHDLIAMGLHFPAVHAGKDISTGLGSLDSGEVEAALQELNTNCHFARAVGASVLVLHLWGLPTSDSSIERNMQHLTRCIDTAEEHGIALAIETIPCVVADPLAHVRRALELDSRCKVALDTEFLAWHNQLEAAIEADWLWQSEQVVHVHIKDYDERIVPGTKRRYLHPGEGRIDFRCFFTSLKERGYHGPISLESPVIGAGGSVDIERLKRSLKNVSELMS